MFVLSSRDLRIETGMIRRASGLCQNTQVISIHQVATQTTTVTITAVI